MKQNMVSFCVRICKEQNDAKELQWNDSSSCMDAAPVWLLLKINIQVNYCHDHNYVPYQAVIWQQFVLDEILHICILYMPYWIDFGDICIEFIFSNGITEGEFLYNLYMCVRNCDDEKLPSSLLAIIQWRCRKKRMLDLSEPITMFCHLYCHFSFTNMYVILTSPMDLRKL